MLKVSFFYFEKQKSFIPKELKPLSKSKQKSFVYLLNFLEGFVFTKLDSKVCSYPRSVWLSTLQILLCLMLDLSEIKQRKAEKFSRTATKVNPCLSIVTIYVHLLVKVCVF